MYKIVTHFSKTLFSFDKNKHIDNKYQTVDIYIIIEIVQKELDTTDNSSFIDR